MATYVMSDIHGCHQELLEMLDRIGFSSDDELIMAGDYIDRGPKTHKMLKWISKTPKNVQLVRGNHEEEFMAYVQLMHEVDERLGTGTDPASQDDSLALYDAVREDRGNSRVSFDMYGTVRKLLKRRSGCLRKLDKWAARMARMPYFIQTTVAGREFVVVHAGWAPSLKQLAPDVSSLPSFYLYARGESVALGGADGVTVVAGHTPTVSKKKFAYNKGHVYTVYDEARDRRFYDIDCGCCMREKNSESRLACLRLDDEAIFYV